MSLNVLAVLAGYDHSGDRESEIAFLRTRTPWVAPEAYLHIIYKPIVDTALLKMMADELALPASMIEFLQQQNGARLFSGNFSLFGIASPGQLLSRKGILSLLPFDIARENRERRFSYKQRFLAVGGYGFDGSTALLDRLEGRVTVVKSGSDQPIMSWTGFEEWLESEITRLSSLFDNVGRLLAEESATVPFVKQ